MNLSLRLALESFQELDLTLKHPVTISDIPTMLKIKEFVFNSIPSEELNDELYTPSEVMGLLNLKPGMKVEVSKFEGECPDLSSIILVPLANEDDEVEPPSTEEICERLIRDTESKCVNAYQKISIEFFQQRYDFQIKMLYCESLEVKFGKISKNLKIVFANEEDLGLIKVKEFDPVTFGIGGLGKAVDTIFKLVIAPRLLPPEISQKLGIKFAKGVLLYGPPGNGKTLIARTFAKTLNVKKPIIVNGPEFLNRYVGEGEGKIRELFAKAIKEQELKGVNSSLHLIIFDEFDAVCKVRGMDSSAGHTDSLVNQLLACMDGVEGLNNILIFAMTNRKDLIDPALLRPGRIEVHIEIGLPSVEGRTEILKIHSKKALEACNSQHNIDFIKLAKMTKNFTGAELEGVVRRTVSEVMYRGIDQTTKKMVNSDIENIQITQEDYITAIKSINPIFGVDENLQRAVELDHPSQKFQYFFNEISANLARGEQMQLHTLLVSGNRGSGKTSMVISAAAKSNFSFIKIIKSSDLVELSEAEKVSFIVNQFKNAYRSEKSLLILENIEHLIGFIPLDKSFSKPVYAVLHSYLEQETVSGRSLMIIGITKNFDLMNDLGFSEMFTIKVHVQDLQTQQEMEKVICNTVNIRGNLRGLSRFIKTISIRNLISTVKAAAEENSVTKELIIKEIDKRK